MQFPASSRALFPGLMAGALLLAGATGCSRQDRAETGDNSAVTQDTAITATGLSSGESSTTPAGGAAVDTAPAQIPQDAPRAATAPSAEPQETPPQGDSSAVAYRAMERDTTNVPESESARVTADTSETSLTTADTTPVETADTAEPSDGSASIADSTSAEIAVAVDTALSETDVTDTAAVGDVEMARDTTTTADQIDTTGVAVDAGGEIQAVNPADTTANAGRIRPPEDSTEILGQVTTDTTITVATADTVESERIRPPEDSTEILGVGEETADEQEINANEQEINAEDRETVATSETSTDAVGAAAIGGTVTGAEAVALMTRQGVRCIIVDPESNEEVRWDMASTPVTLNPCGLGSMVLSRIWVEK